MRKRERASEQRAPLWRKVGSGRGAASTTWRKDGQRASEQRAPLWRKVQVGSGRVSSEHHCGARCTWAAGGEQRAPLWRKVGSGRGAANTTWREEGGWREVEKEAISFALSEAVLSGDIPCDEKEGGERGRERENGGHEVRREKKRGAAEEGGRPEMKREEEAEGRREFGGR